MAFWREAKGGVLVALRVTPNAGADAIEGEEARDDGSRVLRVRVKAVPDKGKANAAVIALLAKKLGLPKSAITLESGETARMKILLVSGEAASVIGRLETLVSP
ncbi:hypothetical protein JP74_19475 [Devosia sp. 17-2-E-8]|uniref:DUF167 family protein n=1 Tax=Paradevosia shaoguanensis TaxID=1335043 RepID=UPI000455CB63|nr:DUF167 family protein [Paradevosia shaoguanensis]KFL25368.1 hypothetical protein JP74_19475 [Devosia sp. 17-2-E-8]QMV00257.1 DUF167 domain-containing protein [Devosia sp. D6-9]CDP53497.1 hypothetical protein [Devosia sp. DBB001]